MERILTASAPLKSLSVDDMRAHAIADKARWNAGAADGLLVTDGTIETGHGTRPVRHVAVPRPRGRPVLHVHGGGWTICDLETHMSIFAGLARASGRKVIAPHARRAPEAPYPAPLDDTVAAIRHMAAAHPDGFFLAGDSAGANLALGALLQLRDTGEAPPVHGLVAFYGCYRRRFDTSSHARCGDGRYGLSTDKMRQFWTHYCGDNAAPYADLSGHDLSGLPPVQAHAAEADPLFDDTLWLHETITAAGGICDLKIWRGVTHGFLHYAAELEAGRDALNVASAFMAERE
ncbi:MAG: alpha/beta hydrolase [Phyllobacteriaceae bacterium]|jgi:acetyl esterase|nr:alpha/beta hydrolase [Phyllobacteriaceae bacterium]